MKTKHTFEDGDVVKYQLSQTHCREGLAIVTKGALLDTFWSTGERHSLSDSEIETAELVFNVNFCRVASKHEWPNYHPNDRGLITHQHGLERDYYLRKGAMPDLATKIENAKEALEEAERKLRSAEGDVRWRKEQLEQLQNPR